MKIYTEVNYEFKDGSLVEQSSKFYNYNGQVAECKTSGSDVVEYVEEKFDEGSEFVDTQTESIQEGPKGEIKQYADELYGGDLKAGITSIQETYKEEEDKFGNALEMLKEKLGGGKVSTDEDTANDGTILTTPEEREDVLQQGKVAKGGREAKFGRQAMVTGTKKSSILNPLQ